MVACTLVLLFTLLNCIGVRRVAQIQNVLTGAKVLTLAGFIVLAFTMGHGSWANLSMNATRTASTTIPAQSLYLMNNPFVLAQSRAAARRLRHERPGDEAEQVVLAYRLALGREPTAGERRLTAGFLAGAADGDGALALLVQALFAGGTSAGRAPPGPGVHGLCGHLAARAALQDLF